jgi:hypothetical protein
VDAAFFIFQRPFWKPDLFGNEDVSDGSAYAEYVIGVELRVVLNVVVVTFGAHKKVAEEVIADAASDVFHEVVTAGEVDTSGSVAGGQLVEEIAGDADPSGDIEAELLRQFRLEESVHIGEDGAVVLVAVVAGLFISPGSLDVEAEAMLEADDVDADVGEKAAFFERGMEIHQIAGFIGGLEGAPADSDINLLRMSEGGKQENASGCDDPELSQYSPLGCCLRPEQNDSGDATASPEWLL